MTERNTQRASHRDRELVLKKREVKALEAIAKSLRRIAVKYAEK